MKQLWVLICAVVFAVLFLGAGSSDSDNRRAKPPTNNSSVQIRKQIADDYLAWERGQ